MYDDFIIEMASAISKELQLDLNAVHPVLQQYWQDKIAHVWKVDDMLEAAYRAGKPITRNDAVMLLQDIFQHHDSSMGISWTNLEVALEEYVLDIHTLAEEKRNEIYGVFIVWQVGRDGTHQFGNYPNKLNGNFPAAFAQAKQMAKQTLGAEIQIGVVDSQSTERIPWLSVTLLKDHIEPTIKECEQVS